MATTITIQTGVLTSSATFQNDTKAQAALLKFYTAYNLGAANATNQQKLNAVRDWFIASVVGASVESHVNEGTPALETAGAALYDFRNGA